LQSAQEYMREAWWLALFPGTALTVTVLALYLVAEGLHARTAPAQAFRHSGPFEQAHEAVRATSPAASQAGTP
jgi:hypothetical protein